MKAFKTRMDFRKNTDHWTSKGKENYSGTTKDWQMKSCHIACTKHNGRKTADRVAQEIMDIAADFDMDIFGVVTDTEPTMCAVGAELKNRQKEWHGFAAHILELTTGKAFSDDSSL